MSASLEFYTSLPTKRMGAGALFFNTAGNILIVKPTYKDCWEIPGGIVEENESPRQAVEREVHEEIGLKCRVITLLSTDYQHPVEQKTESIMFIFEGGVLDEKEINQIKIDGTELSEYRFVPLAEAMKLLSPVLARRMEQTVMAHKNKTAVYLENREIPI